MKQDIDFFLLRGIKPEPMLSVDEWADKNRILSQKASSEAGRYRTERTPYLRQIMEDLSATSPVEFIIFKKGAQVGATEVGNNWVGYVIDHCPSSMMVVQPNIDMAKRNSRTRIDPLIEESPTLKKKVSEKKSRDSSNTTLMKEFPGGVLILAGANSASGLRSAPIRFLFLDEVDAYKTDLDGEGSPVKLAIARTRTFSKRKIFEASTPTTEGESRIAEEFDRTDQNYYHVPCLHCNHFQIISWGQIKWVNKDPKTAYFECIACKHKMFNHEKSKLFENAEWRPMKPENLNRKKRGYHISALYSPHGWYSWSDAVEEFLDARKNPADLKTFTNTVLGETWKEKTERPEWQRIYEGRIQYNKNLVPKPVCFITAGADVQADRIEVEIVGWARNKISYSIDYRVLHGDTNKTEVWDQLDKLVSERFKKDGSDNQLLGIKLLAIDSGFKTQTVYNWVRKFPPNRVVAVKGSDSLNLIHGTPKKTDISMKGKTLRRGLKVWPVGVSIIKAELYGWLRNTKPIDDSPIPHGFCFFPEYEPEFFKMLTAESLVVKYVKGFRKYEWVKDRERNEALDCRVYARAAASICGIDRFTEDNWAALESNFETITENKQTPTPKKKRKRESGFW